MIEKVNDFWVPSNDVHIEQWKSGKPFTQNKCLLHFIDYCEKNNKKFNHLLDIGAWVGTWTMAMNKLLRTLHPCILNIFTGLIILCT